MPLQVHRHTSLAGLGDIEIVHVAGVSAPWSEFHEGFTICRVVSGPSVAWRCGLATHVRSVDRVMLVGPGDLHVDLGAGTSECAMEIVRVTPAAVAAAAATRPTDALELQAHETEDPALLSALDQLDAAIRRGSHDADVESSFGACTRHLLRHCHAEGSVSRPTEEHVALRLARQYMQDHLEEAISLDDLSGATHVGKFHLVKLFRRRLGCTPQTYLMYMRVARARTLLAHGMPCGATAHEAGFCDQSHLNRWFKRVYGTSPGLYLRRHAPDRLRSPLPQHPGGMGAKTRYDDSHALSP